MCNGSTSEGDEYTPSTGLKSGACCWLAGAAAAPATKNNAITAQRTITSGVRLTHGRSAARLTTLTCILVRVAGCVDFQRVSLWREAGHVAPCYVHRSTEFLDRRRLNRAIAVDLQSLVTHHRLQPEKKQAAV